MKRKFKTIFFLLAGIGFVLGQNNALVLNGAFIKLNGGTKSSNIQLVVNQGNASGIVRNSGHIITESQYNYVKWNTSATTGNYIFPIGYSTTDYLPFGFNKTTNTSSSVNVSSWASAADNTIWADTSSVPGVSNMNSNYGGSATTSVIDRWWDVFTSSAATADLTFTYRGAENTTTLNPTGVFAAQRWSGSDWMQGVGAGPGVTSGTGNVFANGVSTFGPWVLSNSGATGALPLTLLSFQSSCVNGKIKLDWVTATEYNMNGFMLQKSFDGFTFFDVAFVPCKNTYTGNNFYAHTDPDEIPSVAFYRLKITGKDNSVDYSGIIEAHSCSKQQEAEGFFNAYNHSGIFKNLPPDMKVCSFTLYDLSGKLLFSEENVSVNNGKGELIFPDVATGIYLFSARGIGFEKTVKLFVY